MPSDMRKVSNQWNVGSVADMIGGIEEKVGHQHGPGCGHDLDGEERPPDNAGIVEIVRWAMMNGKILRNPPVEHMFCGTLIPCIFAGTVPTRVFMSTTSAKKAAIRHAEDFVAIVMVDTKEPDREGKPAQSSYPSLSALLAVVDVNSDPDDPRIHMLIYDGPKSSANGRPVVGYIEDIHRAVSMARKGDALHGMRELDYEAFIVDLTTIVRDHLRKRMEEQEAAIKEAQEAGVSVSEVAAERPEPTDEVTFEVRPQVDTSKMREKLSRMEERVGSRLTPREGRKKLEKKIAAMRAKIASSMEAENEEIPTDGEDTAVVDPQPDAD